MYTIGAAARATGKSKATISRAVKAGRISATRDDEGGYQIDPAELHRVYPATGAINGSSGQMKHYATPSSQPLNGGAAATAETVALQRLLAEREETIRDLRQRLDVATEERQRAAEERERATEERQRDAEERRRLMAMLTDQRVIPAPAAATSDSPRSTGRWFRRWRRRPA